MIRAHESRCVSATVPTVPIPRFIQGPFGAGLRDRVKADVGAYQGLIAFQNSSMVNSLEADSPDELVLSEFRISPSTDELEWLTEGDLIGRAHTPGKPLMPLPGNPLMTLSTARTAAL